MSIRTVRVLMAAAMAFAAVTCGRQAPDLGIAFVRSVTGTAVRVSGLTAAETSALRAASWGAAEWRPLLRVSVEQAGDVSVAGDYAIGVDAVEFTPLFPFDAGRTYVVRFDPARLPAPRHVPIVESRLVAVATPRPSPTTVLDIFPSGNTWPANALRFYIQFSGPMARDAGTRHVHLLDAAGGAVDDGLFTPVVELWNRDQTRYTALFEPGRMMPGLLPNLQLGRPLVPGRQYTIAVDRDWPDAEGQPLSEGFRRSFMATAPRDQALNMNDWQITVPPAGAADALVVRLPSALDRALLERGLSVESAAGAVAGRIAIGPNETEWRFTPVAAWAPGPYRLRAIPELEDIAGNRLALPYEQTAASPAGAPSNESRLTRVLVIK